MQSIQFFLKEVMENRLVVGNIRNTLFHFAIPFLLAGVLQALYGAADVFVVGQYSGSAAVSAVAVGSQVMQTITGIISGITMGITVLLARKVGEEDMEGAGRAIGCGILLLVIVAVFFTTTMVFFTRPIMHLMDTPVEAFEQACGYFVICSLGTPFIIGYNAVSAIFRGLGDSKSPMYFIALACGINIVLDLILVGYGQMGAQGAAYATIAAQGISFFTSLFYLKKRNQLWFLQKNQLHLSSYELKSILCVGCPLALQDALVNVSFLFITAIVNSKGIVAAAAVGVVEKIIVFAMLVPSAFASAVATITAQNVGAGKKTRAFQGLCYGIGFALVFEILFTIYAQFFPESLTSLFSQDLEVVMAGAQYLKAYALDCVLVSFIFCINAFFSGHGKSMIAFAHSMLATFGVRIPLTYLFANATNASLYRVGLAAPAATLVSLIICVIILICMKQLRK